MVPQQTIQVMQVAVTDEHVAIKIRSTPSVNFLFFNFLIFNIIQQIQILFYLKKRDKKLNYFLFLIKSMNCLFFKHNKVVQMLWDYPRSIVDHSLSLILMECYQTKQYFVLQISSMIEKEDTRIEDERKFEDRYRTQDDEFLDYTLESKVEDEELTIDLTCFDMNQQTASFYSITMTEETMPEPLRCIFESPKFLYQECLQKKQNYKVEGNGRLRISFKVVLQSNSIDKEAYINLVSQEKSQREMFKSVLRKMRSSREKEIERERKELLRDIESSVKQEVMASIRKEFEEKLESYKQDILPTILVAVKNKYSQFFRFEGSRIVSLAKSSQEIMLVLNTVLLKNQKKYALQLRRVKNCGSLFLGIISEETTEAKTSFKNSACKAIYFYPSFGEIWKKGKRDKTGLIRMSGETEGEVRMEVDCERGTVRFNVMNEKGEKQELEENLDILGEKKVYPYIDFYQTEAEVEVTLTSLN